MNETWIPSPNNRSKLIKHWWDGREWRATCYARYVPWADDVAAPVDATGWAEAAFPKRLRMSAVIDEYWDSLRNG